MKRQWEQEELIEPEADPREGEEEGPITLHHLRMDPGRVGVETMLIEITKLRRLREMRLPVDLFSHLSPKVVRVYRQRASAETPSLLRAHPEPIRLTLLAALCWQRSQEIIDSLVDLLIQIVHRIGARRAQGGRSLCARVEARGRQREYPLSHCRCCGETA